MRGAVPLRREGHCRALKARQRGANAADGAADPFAVTRSPAAGEPLHPRGEQAPLQAHELRRPLPLRTALCRQQRRLRLQRLQQLLDDGGFCDDAAVDFQDGQKARGHLQVGRRGCGGRARPGRSRPCILWLHPACMHVSTVPAVIRHASRLASLQAADVAVAAPRASSQAAITLFRNAGGVSP